MKKLLAIILLLTCFSAIVSFPCFAQTASSSAAPYLFERGNQAFRNKDYNNALSLFLQAKAQGMEHVSLFYNIGVCAYKTGNYPQARQAFEKVAENKKMAPLAYYNLGLIAIKEKDQATAAGWFGKTIETAKDERLRSLAVDARQGLSKKTTSPWFGFLSLGLGYDDNVKTVYDGDTQTTTGQGDAFTEMMFFTRGPLLKGSKSQGLNIQLSGYSLYFEDLRESNYSSVNPGILYIWGKGPYRTEVGGDYDYSFVGGDKYSQISSAFIELQRITLQSSLRFKYRFSSLDILEEQYDYLTGIRNTFETEAGRFWEDLSAWLGYSLELNDRDDEDNSPTRHKVRLKIKVKATEHLKLYAMSSFRRSDYDITNGIDREDNLIKASMRIAYALSRPWELGAEYRYDKNDSNYSSFDYTRNTTLLNITMNF